MVERTSYANDAPIGSDYYISFLSFSVNCNYSRVGICICMLKMCTHQCELVKIQFHSYTLIKALASVTFEAPIWEIIPRLEQHKP